MQRPAIEDENAFKIAADYNRGIRHEKRRNQIKIDG
jgi:hypothetical protein